jgi:hypothetical protein
MYATEQKYTQQRSQIAQRMLRDLSRDDRVPAAR